MNFKSVLLAFTLLCAAAANAHEGMHEAHGATRQPLAVSAFFDAGSRVWRASEHGGYVLVSFSDDKGKSYSAPVKVNQAAETIAADGDNRPKIIVKQGVVYVSYTQSLEKLYTGNIRFSRSLDGGKSFSPPVTVNDNHDMISHRFDALGVNERGQVFIAWLDKRDSSAAQQKGKKYTGAAVYYAVSDDGGAHFGTNLKVIDYSCECCRIAMAMGADGVPVIFWRNVYGKNVRDHAMIRLDGKSRPVRVSFDNWAVDACPHHGPSLSIAPDGMTHLVWFDNVPGKSGLFYASTADGGKTFSAPLSFGSSAAQAAHPYVLSVGEKVVVAWKEFDGENSVVMAMISHTSGQQWSAPVRLAATAGASDHPILIADGNTPYLSWNTAKEGAQLIMIGNGTVAH